MKMKMMVFVLLIGTLLILEACSSVNYSFKEGNTEVSGKSYSAQDVAIIARALGDKSIKDSTAVAIGENPDIAPLVYPNSGHRGYHSQRYIIRNAKAIESYINQVGR